MNCMCYEENIVSYGVSLKLVCERFSLVIPCNYFDMIMFTASVCDHA
jgi:hypothetical protein